MKASGIFSVLLIASGSLVQGLEVRCAIEAEESLPDQLIFNDWVELTGISRKGENPPNISTASAGRFKELPLRFETASVELTTAVASRLAAGSQTGISLEVYLPGAAPNISGTRQEYLFEGCLFSDLSLNADVKNEQPVTGFAFEYSSMTWTVTNFTPLGEPLQVARNQANILENLHSLIVENQADDDDGDGMANLWEEHYGLDANSALDRDLDLDKDGLSNYAEFLAGTDPTKFTSQLKAKVTKPMAGASEVSLEWTSVPGRTYQIEGASDALDEASWQVMGTVEASSGERTFFEVPRNLAAKASFYRVKVMP